LFAPISRTSSSNDVNAFSDFQKLTWAPAARQQRDTSQGYHCTVPNCRSACSIRLPPVCGPVGILMPWILLGLCPRCSHPYLFHLRLQSQRGLGHVIDSAADGRPQSPEDYAGPWPSASLSTRVEKATRLLKQSHKDMGQKGVSW
jgi:hypothetical protein